MFGLFSDYSDDDFQLEEGLNVDETFDEKFDGIFDKFGLNFYSIENIVNYIEEEGEDAFRNRLAFISIPKDAKIIYFDDFIRTDKVIVNKIIDLEDWGMWKNEEFCLKAVKQNGFVLRFVKNQTKEMCFEAINQDGNFLEYIRNPTEEMCLEAVKQNGFALQYVKNQTEAICLQAIKNEKNAFEYVKNKTKSINELYSSKKQYF